MLPICYIWKNTNVKWSQADWKWSECKIAEEIVGILTGVDATTLIQPWNPYKQDLDKKKKLVRLICKCKGEIFNEEKEVKDIHITISDAKLVVKSVLGIDVKMKE